MLDKLSRFSYLLVIRQETRLKCRNSYIDQRDIVDSKPKSSFPVHMCNQLRKLPLQVVNSPDLCQQYNRYKAFLYAKKTLWLLRYL